MFRMRSGRFMLTTLPSNAETPQSSPHLRYMSQSSTAALSQSVFSWVFRRAENIGITKLPLQKCELTRKSSRATLIGTSSRTGSDRTAYGRSHNYASPYIINSVSSSWAQPAVQKSLHQLVSPPFGPVSLSRQRMSSDGFVAGSSSGH